MGIKINEKNESNECSVNDHPHQVIAFGEDEDCNEFVEMKCDECGVYWEVEKSWEAADFV